MASRYSSEYIKLEDPTLEGLQIKIAEYERKYPYAGYGTFINEPKFDEKSKMWIATGSRSSSCD